MDGRVNISASDQRCFTSDLSDVKLSFLLILGLSVLVENIVGIIILCTTKSLKTTSNLFVISLAVTDIVSSGAFTIMSMTSLVVRYSDIGAIFDTIAFITVSTMFLLTVIHNAVCAVERYIFLLKPFVYLKYVTRKTVHKIIAFVWIFCLIFQISTLMETFLDGHRICTSRQIPRVMIMCIGLPIYTVSIIVAGVAYVKIPLEAFRRRRKVGAQLEVTSNQIQTTKFGQNKPDMRKVSKSVKFFLTVFGVFFIMTFPAIICMALTRFIFIPDSVYRICVLFGSMQCGSHFLILALVNSDFRKALSRAANCNRTHF